MNTYKIDTHKKTIIYFLKKNAPYNSGEFAGFIESKANEYVKSGTACHVDKNGEPIVPKMDDPEEEKVAKEKAKLATKAVKELKESKKGKKDDKPKADPKKDKNDLFAKKE